MNKAILLGTAGVAVALAMLAVGFIAGKQGAVADAPPQAMMSEAVMDRPEVERIVREYLIANPEVMIEVQAALDTKQKEEQRVASLQVIQVAKGDIFNSEHDG